MVEARKESQPLCQVPPKGRAKKRVRDSEEEEDSEKDIVEKVSHLIL